MYWRLQPYVLVAATLPARPRRGAKAGALQNNALEAATLCVGGCNPMCWWLQPYQPAHVVGRKQVRCCVATA